MCLQWTAGFQKSNDIKGCEAADPEDRYMDMLVKRVDMQHESTDATVQTTWMFSS